MKAFFASLIAVIVISAAAGYALNELAQQENSAGGNPNVRIMQNG